MVAAQQEDFWGQFEVVEYDKPQYDEKYWGQFEEAPESMTKNAKALETSIKELPDNDPYVQSENYQLDQLANTLFTKEELNEIDSKGKMGWLEYRSRGFVGWSDITPIVGTVKQAHEAGKALSISKKMEKGEEISDADKAYMTDYLRKYVEVRRRGMTWGATGVNMFVQAPAFMAEFALTGGLGEAAAKGAITATTKGASKVALKGAARTAARFAGQQAVLVPMYATANYNERKIADGLNITDKGDLIFNNEQAESNKGKKVFQGLATGEIQVLSELSGGLIGKMASGIGGAVGKGISKVATTNTARGISATSAKIYNSLPKNVRVKLEASARVIENAGKKAADAGKKMKEKGDIVAFNGIAEEMGEERVEDVLMTAFDLDSKQGYSADEWLDAIFPSPQQLLLEAGVFSIVGATSLATRTVASDLLSKGYSEEEATNIVNSLSEVEKENLANEIIGEVKINEDIKEQEVVKQEAKIENALQGGIEINVNANGETVKEKPKTLTDYKREILNQKFEQTPIETIKWRYNKNVVNKPLPIEENKYEYINRDFNSIINKIYKNPEIINDAEELQKLEDELDRVIYELPEEEEIIKPYYERFWNAVSSASDYSEAKSKKRNKVAADAEFYDMADTAGATPSEAEEAKKEWEEKGTDSKYFKRWFGNSKVVDEDGKPRIVYHGSVNTFDTFDKSKASPEGDMGAGFYFTSDEFDADYNYHDGGPDFDNKVARLAEQIQNENEDLDYEEAKEIADKQLRGEPHQFECYLKIDNPCYVGENETVLLADFYDRVAEINEEDYEDYDEYEQARQDAEDEVFQTISYEIDDVLGRILQYEDIEKAKGILFENLYDGGITLQKLKDRLNEEYFENPHTGDFVGNEVARGIVEALGYDGIIDSSVSEKFNMHLGAGTTHYIVFKPEQIKSVENQGTFDESNPNIYYEEDGGRTRKPKAEKPKQQTQTPVTEAAETVENELDTAETVADKIIRGESKWGKFYTEWVDRYTPIENLVKKAEQKTGEKIDTTNNPYFQARMYAGLVESIKQQVNDKTFIKDKDGSIKITGEGFLPIINDYVEEIKDIEPNYDKAIEDLSDYLIANRYLLDLKDREGYEATEEQKVKALEDMTKLNLKYGDKIEDISKIADRIYKFNQRILHNLVDSGNMSQELYDKIIAENPHHISYKRIMDDEKIGSAFVSKGKFTDAKSPVKRIKGSERDIQNIFVSTLEDVSRILDAAERNKVARSIADLKDILPEYIETKKPTMEKRTAMVKVAYDAKMRQQLLEAINYFGREFENVKSIKTPTGYAWGSYSESEQLVRKKLGSQDRTLAHEVGHMLDFALGVERKIKNNPAIMKEIKTLAEDRFASIVKLQDGEFITEEAGTTEKHKNYIKSNKEMIANAFDLYFTSRDYVKRVAPETSKFINNLFKGEYKFLNDIRPSSETATEEIEQDVWTPSRTKPYGNVIQYFVEGKPKYIEVTKPVMDAVEGMNSQEIDFVNKFLVGSASMLRTGATITPEFAIRNFIRDQESATIYIKNYNPFIDSVRGLMNVLGKKVTGKNEIYDEWVKAAGAFGSYMELNEKSVNKALKEFVGKGSKINKVFDANPIKLAEDFSSIFEQATRLSMYTRSKMNGASAMEAAFEAREGTLDFGRSGSLGRKYNRFLPFFNAGIQGVDKMVRTFRDHPYLSSIKAIATMTLPQLAVTGYYLYFAPDDDREDYLNIPQYQKDFFYCFKIGENWVRIPKDFTLGYVFGSIPERFLTWAYQNKKPEGKDLAKMAMTLLGSVSPINNPTDAIPPIFRTLIENISNYDFFRGQHIYPEYMNNLEPSLRANKFNSESAKLLGEKLNMSPAIIDHTISSLLGTSGKYLTDAGDLILNSVREFNGEEINEKVRTTADAPFLRGFVIRDPIGYQAVSTNEFFENYKKVSEAHATYNKYLKTDREAARNYKQKHETDLRAYDKLNNTKKQISALGKQMDKIYSDKSLSNKEKQEALQPLAKKISDIAFDANVWYGDFIKE